MNNEERTKIRDNLKILDAVAGYGYWMLDTRFENTELRDPDFMPLSQCH